MNDDALNSALMKNLSMGFNEILKNFIATRAGSKEIRFFSGRVVNNSDPDKEGKCKIRVYGIFPNEIPDDDLPWSTPDFNFIGGLKGSFVVPPIDAIVRVYFDNGDIYAPFYTTKAFNKNQLDFNSDISEDYPDTMVFFETDQGEYFKINRKTQMTTYKHSSGAILTIDVNGNINLSTEAANEGSLTINIQGDTKINVVGDTDIIAEGTVKVDGLQVELGKNAAKQLVNNLPTCIYSGAPHTIGNTNVKC